MIEDPLGGVILIGGYSVRLGRAPNHFLRLAHAGPGKILELELGLGVWVHLANALDTGVTPSDT